MTELAALNVKISGDSGGLVSAVNSADNAITSFGRVTTAAEANARGFDRTLRNATGGASNLQRQINSLTGVLNNNRRSAENSARVFDRLGDEAAAAGVQMAGASARARGVSENIGSAQGSLGNFAAQFNDIGVMLAAGQNPLQLALQQGTQLNQAFAAMGAQGTTAAGRVNMLGRALLSVVSPANLITIGTIAGGAALFQFGMSALGASEEVRTYEDALEDLERITNDVKRASDILDTSMYDLIAQYGEAAQRVRELAVAEIELAIARQRGAVTQAMQNEEVQNALSDYGRLTTLVDELGNTYYDTSDAARAIQRDLGVTGQTASDLAIEFNALRNAVTIEDQAASWSRINALFERAGVSLSELPPELATALATVVDLEQAMIDYTAAAQNAAAATEGISAALPMTVGGIGPDIRDRRGRIMLPGMSEDEDEETFGGLSLADQIERDLERLREGFMSEEELQVAAYERQQELLQEALNRRLLTQEEYNGLMQDAQAQHQDRMADIDAYRYGSGVQQTQQFMGDMARALQNGNDQMARISRVFAAGETLINAWRAYNQTLADPTLPFFAKIPAALSVLSAGMGAVNAIRGMGGGGGAAGAGAATSAATSAASAAPARSSNSVALQLTGGDMFSRDQIIGLINAINEAQEDGAIVRLV